MINMSRLIPREFNVWIRRAVPFITGLLRSNSESLQFCPQVSGMVRPVRILTNVSAHSIDCGRTAV